MRKIIFFTVIFVSLAGGLVFGWVVKPSLPGQVKLANLREDYRTDLVLMAAEVYASDFNLETAAGRLEPLKADTPANIAQAALLYAQRAGYSEADLALLQSLARDLQKGSPATPEPVP